MSYHMAFKDFTNSCSFIFILKFLNSITESLTHYSQPKLVALKARNYIQKSFTQMREN